MEILFGLLFNSIWIIGSYTFGCLLFWLFRFVSLPAWLEMSIIVALSFWVGLTLMLTFIGRCTGESWSECREKARGMLGIGIPTAAACVVAVVSHLLICKFILDEEIAKFLVGAIALTFWSLTMHISTKRLEKQSAQSWDEHKRNIKRD